MKRKIPMPEQVQFYGVDCWGRPVFRSLKFKENFFGSVNILFGDYATEDEVLEKVKAKDLLFFGNTFGCEPMGDQSAVPLEIVRKSPKKQKKTITAPRKFVDLYDLLDAVEGALGFQETVALLGKALGEDVTVGDNNEEDDETDVGD
jgi:hypothetical protein